MISVIIPALNEAQNLPGVLAALAGDGVEAEIIVVDGGSADGTPDVARRAGVRVIETAPGRGGQLRAGAEAAAGDVLWFLHADSRVPAGALIAVADALAAAPEAVGGNFRLLFDGDDEFSRWLDDFYARIRAKGVYYGGRRSPATNTTGVSTARNAEPPRKLLIGRLHSSTGSA